MARRWQGRLKLKTQLRLNPSRALMSTSIDSYISSLANIVSTSSWREQIADS